MFTTEYFGPILAVHVYEDGDFEKVVRGMESIAPYALTGSIIAQDRRAIAWAQQELRFAAGNFYINDKPTGAVVGQQPFGGGRASGTNDKAGAAVNLLRWTSPRSIKETFVPPTDYRYPLPRIDDRPMILLHMGALHPFEQALTLVLAFGPFLVLAAVIVVRRRQDRPRTRPPTRAGGSAREVVAADRVLGRRAPCGAGPRSASRSCRRPAGC